MYVPTLGRMPSVDPLYAGAIEEPQRWNRYAYGLNSPIVVTDPDGRVACTGTGDGQGFVGGCSQQPTPPAFVQEHSADLFLWLQYGDFGYHNGNAGGVNMAEWDAATQKPMAQAAVALAPITIDIPLIGEVTIQTPGQSQFNLPFTPPVTAAAKVGGETVKTAVGRVAHKAFSEAVKAKTWVSELRIESLIEPGKWFRVDALTARGYILELKPRTVSGIKAGLAQARTYAEHLQKKVRVVYYDPLK